MSYHARALRGPRTRAGAVEVLWIEVECRVVIIRIAVIRKDTITTQDFDPADYQEE